MIEIYLMIENHFVVATFTKNSDFSSYSLMEFFMAGRTKLCSSLHFSSYCVLRVFNNALIV